MRTSSPDTRALKEYLRITHNASLAEQKHRLDMPEYASAYKEHWGPKFEAAEKGNYSPPSVLPHPDDVVIDHNGVVDILGPVDREGQRTMKATIILRDTLLAGLEMYTDLETQDQELIKGRQFILKRLAKLERALPPRLRQNRGK